MIKVWVLFILLQPNGWIIKPMEKFTSYDYCRMVGNAIKAVEPVRIRRWLCIDMDYDDAQNLKSEGPGL